MLGHHNGVEARFLGKDGVLDEGLGLELLVAAEVGEASQRVLLSGLNLREEGLLGQKVAKCTLIGHPAVIIPETQEL